MPGLIDGHAHAGHGLIKTMGMGRGNRWDEACERGLPPVASRGFLARRGPARALERLRFGVTCGVSLLGGGDTIMRTDEPDYGDAHCEGVAEVGTRSSSPSARHAPRIRAPTRERATANRYPVTFERPDGNLPHAHRPHGMAREASRSRSSTPTLRDEHLAEWPTRGLCRGGAQAQATRAQPRPRGSSSRRTGTTGGVNPRAQALGLLGPDALLSHAIDLHPDEIGICARPDTKIAHNPSAIASILGRCPAAGTDRGGGHGLRSARTPRRPTAPPTCSATCSRRCTITAAISAMPPSCRRARCWRWHHRRGSRAGAGPGDRLAGAGQGGGHDPVDMRRPHLYPLNMAAYRVACFANGNDVDTVVIGGEVVLQGGRPPVLTPPHPGRCAGARRRR
jgi:5-methylthioadenosine/S-adenosylhomocysteine deaminase